MNYYLISITDNYIYYNSKSLKENLKEKNTLLYKRELNKVDMLYNNKLNKSNLVMEYHDYVLETEQLYVSENIPKYIVAKGNVYSVREIITGVRLVPSSILDLEIRKVSKEKALEYLENNLSYVNSVNNFFNININSKRKVKNRKR